MKNKLKPVRFGLTLASRRGSLGAALVSAAILALSSIAIAHASGAIGFGNAFSTKFCLDHLFVVCVGLSLAWITNRINCKLNFYRLWLEQPLWHDLAPACANVIVAICGALVAYVVRQRILDVRPDWGVARDIALMTAAFTALAGFAYRLSFVNALRARAVRRARLLGQASATAQMASLKAQLDPHFLLNCINALCHLVERRVPTATAFADNLAWTYQYVVEKGQADFVRLEEELEFVERYVDLIKLRFGDTVTLSVENLAIAITGSLIPPLALQTLVENAVKHNEHSDDVPLKVLFRFSEKSVSVVNRVQSRSMFGSNEGVGLANLRGRVRLLTGLNVHVDHTGDLFSVVVPLVRAGT